METMNLFLLLSPQITPDSIISQVKRMKEQNPTLSEIKIYILTTFYTRKYGEEMKTKLESTEDLNDLKLNIEIKRISSRDPLDIVITLKSIKAKGIKYARIEGGTSLLAYFLIKILEPDYIFYHDEEIEGLMKSKLNLIKQ